MSKAKTPYLGLNNWERSDEFCMDDFNEDNIIIDEEVNNIAQSCAYIKLVSITIPQDISQVEFDMTGFDMQNMLTLEVYVLPKKSSGKAEYLRLRPNNLSSESDYLSFYNGRWVDGGTAISLEMGFCKLGFGNTGYAQFIYNSIASNCCRKIPRLSSPSEITTMNFLGENGRKIPGGTKILIVGVKA